MNFTSFSTWLNEAAYNKDMFNEFGYFNQFLTNPLSSSQFKKLIEQAKTEKISYNLFPNIIMRYDQGYKDLLNMQNKSEKELLNWWKPKYLEMKKFEKDKQSDDYYNKLVQAIKDDKIDTPIIILSIDDENGKNYKFVCGGRNRVILSTILKKNIDVLNIKLPKEKKKNIEKIINKRND